jgi:DNA modification methylase
MSIRTETIGDATLYLGDCRDILPGLPKAEAVITDPPYMFSTASALGKLNPWADICNAAVWFSDVMGKCRDRLPASGGFVWWFLNWRTMPTIQKAAFDIDWHVESLLVWDKDWIGPGGSKGLRPSYEMVALLCTGDAALPNRGLRDIWKHPASSQKLSGHPAEKPLSLLRELIKQTPAQTVLDPFMGSGTTGAAAVAERRSFVGVEMDPKWFDIACRRIEEAYRQPRLFAEPAPKPVQQGLDL